MLVNVLFVLLSVFALVLGVIRIANYDLAYRIEAWLKRLVRMKMSARTPQWESSSRFTGFLLIILGALNLFSVLR